jgi:benzoate/toluate 1,2-dioxygenase reductase subunit
MRPKTDCAIDIAATAQGCKTAERSFSATLRAVDRLSDSSFALTLDADAQLAFLPGQYAKILVPDTEARRSYSFSSAPGDAVLSFLIRNLPNGAMSSFLAERARPGLTMNLTGPLGSFYLRDIKRPLLFVAGGTGIAPFLSMLGQLTRMGANERPIHLLHGVSYDADLVAVQQLDAYAAALPGFSFTTCVSRAGSAHPRRGHVTDFLDADHLHGGDVDVYVCGPPGMVDALRDSLSARGVTPANLYTEKFLASGNEPLRNAA